MALQRRKRAHCHLPCEIVRGRTRSDATVVTLSEGGLAVRTALDIEEGDVVHIRILPKVASRTVEVEALVWNTAGRSKRRTIGFVVSEPPTDFLELLEEAAGPETRSQPRRQVRSQARRAERARASHRPAAPPAPAKPARVDERVESFEFVQEQPVDPALPRPRDPLPPPKPDPPESLPLFRVRIKHLEGPRSRRLEIRARSVQDCATWIRDNLDGDWEILEHKRVE